MPDLALTRFVGVPTGSPLDTAHSWGTLDLALAPRKVGIRATAPGIAAVAGRANLAQALIVRLLTPRGSLAALGHPDYGSRLGELIGRRNDVGARNLARLHVIEAVGQEPRVHELVSLDVRADPSRPDVVAIAFSVVPVPAVDPSGEPIALSLEVVT